jgi:hypothetical protein
VTGAFPRRTDLRPRGALVGAWSALGRQESLPATSENRLPPALYPSVVDLVGIPPRKVPPNNPRTHDPHGAFQSDSSSQALCLGTPRRSTVRGESAKASTGTRNNRKQQQLESARSDPVSCCLRTYLQTPNRFPKPGVVGSIPTGGAVRFVQFGIPYYGYFGHPLLWTVIKQLPREWPRAANGPGYLKSRNGKALI